MEEKSKLDRIEETLNKMAEESEQKKKPKEFKIPFFKRVMGRKARDNYVTIMKINENRDLSFEKVKIFEQTVMVDGLPRMASAEYTLRWKKNPIIIIPSWSVEPFSPTANFKTSLENGSNVAGYRLLLNRMQTEAVKLGKKVGGLGIGIGVLVVVAIIVYALFAG